MKNTLTLTGRLMKHTVRSTDTIITAVIQPILMMLLFVYVFGGAFKLSLPEGTNYVNYQLPGVLLMTVGYGTAYTALRMFNDSHTGITARFSTMPIHRSSALWAHVLTSIVANLVSLVIMFLVALLIGFRSGAGIFEWLMTAGILTLFTLALTWAAVIPGLAAKTVEGATGLAMPIIFLPFLSSAFIPTETMPGPLRVFAENQPVSPIVVTMRNLLNGEPAGNEIWVALAWCVGIMLIAWIVATRMYKKKV